MIRSYLDEAASPRLLQMAEEAAASGVHVDIRAYEAAQGARQALARRRAVGLTQGV